MMLGLLDGERISTIR